MKQLTNPLNPLQQQNNVSDKYKLQTQVRPMLDRLTSTWAILLFLLGVLIVASFLPTGPNINASESARPEVTLDGDVLNQDLSAAGAVNQLTQTN